LYRDIILYRKYIRCKPIRANRANFNPDHRINIQWTGEWQNSRCKRAGLQTACWPPQPPQAQAASSAGACVLKNFILPYPLGLAGARKRTCRPPQPPHANMQYSTVQFRLNKGCLTPIQLPSTIKTNIIHIVYRALIHHLAFLQNHQPSHSSLTTTLRKLPHTRLATKAAAH